MTPPPVPPSVPDDTLHAPDDNGVPTGAAPTLNKFKPRHVRPEPRPTAPSAPKRPSAPVSATPIALPPRPAPPPRPKASGPLQVPGYELLGELGRGGMGVVYKARQTGLNRLVALKMIRSRGHADAEDLARFKLEAEAVARLHHPHIVQIYDVGAQDDLPYFSLEYCTGGTLAQQIDGTPLPPSVATRLLRQIADAVHTAHTAGILHRDLKPANILLQIDNDNSQLTQTSGGARSTRTELLSGTNAISDSSRPTDQWVPKLTDFGLAKELDVESGQTQSGAILGTPSYMAPEQADSSQHHLVGPASDIWALGAVLYELLTGRPPFKGPTPMGTILLVLTQEPVPPTQLQPTLPRDLETIVLKCLHKDPRKRYASARALAEDLQRFTNSEPIQARPAGWVERTIKFARRRPAIATLLALLVVGSFGMAGLAGWALQQKALAEANQQQAEANAEAAHRETERANQERRTARKAIDKLTDSFMQKKLESAKALTEADRAYLRGVLVFYEQFARQGGNTDQARAEQAGGMHKVAVIQAKLGQTTEAVQNEEAARAIQLSLAHAHSSVPAYAQELATTHNSLGNLYRTTGRLTEAEAEYQAARVVQLQLAAAHPTVTDYAQDLATTHNNLALLYHETGRLKEAGIEYQAARVIQLQLTHADPDSIYYAQDLARTHNNLGLLYSATGRSQEAEAAHHAARALQLPLTRAHPTDADYAQELAKTHNNLGNLYGATGRAKEAESEYHAGRAIQLPLVDAHPSVSDYAQELAKTHNNLGNLYRATGRAKEAEAEFQAACAIQLKLTAAHPTVTEYAQNLATTHNNLGLLYHTTGRSKEAETEFQAARRIRAQLAAAHPTVTGYAQELARTHLNLGALFHKTGRPKEAGIESQAARVIQLQLAHAHPSITEYAQELAKTHNNLGLMYRAAERLKEAEVEYHAARTLQLQLTRAHPSVTEYAQDLARTHNNLGNLYSATERSKEAEAEYHAARALQQKLTDAHPTLTDYAHELAKTHNNLGNLYGVTGRAKEAEVEYQAARALQLQLTHAHPSITDYAHDLVKTHLNLGNLFYTMGRWKEVKAEYQAACALQQKLAAAYPTFTDYAQELARTLCYLGNLERELGRPAEGLEHFERAISTLAEVRKRQPNGGNVRPYLRYAHASRAQALTALARHAEAAADWERAAEFDLGPTQAFFRRREAEAWARAGQTAKAMLLAEEALTGTLTAEETYNIACVLALCAAAKKDDLLAARAVGEVRKAWANGYHNLLHIEADSDLAGLRERADWKAWLAEVKPTWREPIRVPPRTAAD